MLKVSLDKKYLILLLMIIFLSIGWLFSNGIVVGHDTAFHYNRIIGLSNTIKNGDFLALIYDFYYGYGYANGLFYSNFYFYIPAFLSILGLSYMASFKILYIFITICTTLSIYYCLKSITKDNKISLIGTILYMFSNYRIVDIFVRGAMGEMLAFMIIPIVLLGIYEIVYRDYPKWYLFSIGFVLLLLSHVITTFLLAGILLIFLLCNYKRLFYDKYRIKYLLLSGIIGLFLGSFFLFPIMEQKITGNISIFLQGSFCLPQDEVVSLKDFFVPTGFFNKFIGITFILLLPIRLFIKKKETVNKELLNFADVLYLLAIISWVCTTNIFPWNIVGESLNFIQFPWRLLIIATSFLTFSYSIYFKYLTNNTILKCCYVFIILFSCLEIIIYSIQYGIRVDRVMELPENIIASGEYLLYGTNVEELEKENPIPVSNNSELEMSYQKHGTSLIINYKNNFEKNTYIEVPLFNYLGYDATGATIVNGQNNLIRLLVDKEEGRIEVKYQMTFVQKFSYVISFITFLFLSIFIIRKVKSSKY